MGIAGTLSSALVVPVSNLWGWSIALLSFLILPIMAIIVWLPQLKRNREQGIEQTTKVKETQSNTKITHSLLA